jgi:hypothetical protein
MTLGRRCTLRLKHFVLVITPLLMLNFHYTHSLQNSQLSLSPYLRT